MKHELSLVRPQAQHRKQEQVYLKCLKLLTPSVEKIVNLYLGLTLRRLMSYIYMEHPFLMFLDHTQRRSTVGRTPLDE